MTGTRTITLYDTTLRDGSQSEDVQFSVEDKLRIARRLDEFGLPYVEGGWPGANPTDEEFFQRARHELTLSTSRLTAFGSTRRAGQAVEKDATMQGLLRAETSVVTIFGKSWDLHVTRALGISLEENLDLIADSIRFLKKRVDRLFYDAEHFFDGFRANPAYAMQTLIVAQEAGADCLVLCDTNGGTLVGELMRLTRQVGTIVATPLGIHCHNDSDLAVANSLAAVEAGVEQVQGTINGIGERCGNADLASIIPNLVLKMGLEVGIPTEQLIHLTSLSRFVNEMANRASRRNQPFVGSSAFSHKGGIHASAVLKDAVTYEHIRPELVGNRHRILVSEQSGRSNLVHKLRDLGWQEVDPEDARVHLLLQRVKELENEGFQFEGAEASFELLALRTFGLLPLYFTLGGFRVIDERHWLKRGIRLTGSEATVKINVQGGVEHLIGEGTGPVDALHKSLCKALVRYYPSVDEVMLIDYKVRILSKGGTDAKVRVLIEWRDNNGSWSTMGVSDHIIEASYDAMVDALYYKLYKDGVQLPDQGELDYLIEEGLTKICR